MQFNANAIAHALRQNNVGQEEVLWQIASHLQTLSVQLQTLPGCFCQLLLAGPAHTGKASVAHTLAKYFDGSAMKLLHVTPATIRDDRIRLNAHCRQQGMIELTDAVFDLPRAVILLENIEQFPAHALAIVREIITEGCHIDPSGREINFSHTTLIMTTDVSATHFPAQPTAPVYAAQDLLQLLAQEAPQKSTPPQLAAHHLRRALLPALAAQLPAWLLRAVPIMPFMPATLATAQHVVKQKISGLIQHVLTHHHVQLEITPEACNFLAEKIFHHCYTTEHAQFAESPDRLLMHVLHPCIAQQLIGGTTSGTTLRVQLNESGDVLVCDAKCQLSNNLI